MNRNRSWPGVPNRYSHRLPGQRDAAEVHRHRGGGLAVGHTAGVVDADGVLGHRGLGRERLDVRDGPDEGRLADGEPAGDDDLDDCRGGAGAAGGVCSPAGAPDRAASERGNAIENTLQHAEGGQRCHPVPTSDRHGRGAVRGHGPCWSARSHTRIRIDAEGQLDGADSSATDMYWVAVSSRIARLSGGERRSSGDRAGPRPAPRRGRSTERTERTRPPVMAYGRTVAGLVLVVLASCGSRRQWPRGHPTAGARVAPSIGRRERISETSCGVSVASVRLTSIAIS